MSLTDADVLRKIEDILAAFIEETMATRKPASLQVVDPKGRPSTVKASQRDGRRLAIHLRLLEIIHGLLVGGGGMQASPRDVYYQDVRLFGSPGAVSTALEGLCRRLQVPRDALHIIASPRGLVYGPGWREATGIPTDDTLIGYIKFVLVVEKEAVFMTILTAYASLSERFGPFLLGKGYPCMATRRFLSHLSLRDHLKFYGLFDNDPHGLQILYQYRVGSEKLLYDRDSLSVPSLALLGVTCHDLDYFADAYQYSRLPLTKHDLSCLQGILKRASGHHYHDLVHELEHIRERQFKAEIESISHDQIFFLQTYLPWKLSNC